MIGIRKFWNVYFSKDKTLISQIKHITGYYPNNVSVYILALRHSSLVKDSDKSARECNERLEYLGDAVLGAVIAEYLYKKYPLKDEGFLTEMRSKIVNRASLNDLAIKMGLDRLLVHDFKSANIRNQSIYGNTLEAFIGAFYIDHGYKTTQKFIKMIVSSFVDINEVEKSDTNFKSKLLEFTQKHKLDHISYEILSDNGASNSKFYTIVVKIGDKVLGKGSDHKKKVAEQKASEVALAMLQRDYSD